MQDLAKKTLVLTGQTSSGKSDIAVKLANIFDGEVISADSRQIYKHLDLGAGKVEGKWQVHQKKEVFLWQGIAHHLIDFVQPQAEYNVSNFLKDAFAVIDELCEKKKTPIVCGGSVFWISALLDNLVLPAVKPDFALRKELDQKTSSELLAELKTLDSARAENIDPNNKVRLIRAIEICQTLGQVPAIKKYRFEKNDPVIQTQRENKNYLFLQIGLRPDQKVLDQRIRQRLWQRFEAGMLEEIKALHEKEKLSWEKIQSFGLAYYWLPLYLQNKISFKEAQERVFLAERQYAKRQMTWLKRDKRIVWENQIEKIVELSKKFLQA